jgi:KaiC/GvpD/RAD55 family RecA-like ATPase
MRSSTGVPGLDNLLEGGLILGENVVLEVESGTFEHDFLTAFMREGIRTDSQVIYLEFIYPPQALLLLLTPLLKKFPKGWEDRFLVLDCFSDSSGRSELIFTDFYDSGPNWIRKVPSSKDAESFHHFFGRIEREFITEGTRLVFNSLTAMEVIWGTEFARALFGHICPALYAYKTLAYWTIMKHAHSREFISAIEHATQVVVDLAKRNDTLCLQVKKAGARYNSSTYRRYAYAVEATDIKIKEESAE